MIDDGVEKRKSYLAGDLANQLGAKLKGDPDVKISGIGALEEASTGQLSFVTSPRYSGLALECNASALIVPTELKDLDRTLLVCEQPYLALARAAQLFADPPALAEGIHESAFVGEGAALATRVSVGALAHIGCDCRIGKDTRIYGGAYLGNGVRIGEQCLIYPGVTILDGCRVGNRVTIHSGTVIGGDGFGYAQDEQGRHVKIPQTGIVCIDDDVEIGSNCAVDRATFGRTWIQRGTKIDNLVQIGHNVIVGEDSILISQVGVSGSTKIGKHVVLAGQVGIVGHIEIGDGVRIGAKSGVNRSVKAGLDVSGIPAIPHKEFLKELAIKRRLPELKEELRQLKQRVQKLEEALGGN
jgi:UDP-3-O-[3-hydroxymyristoyl] glucosamine N-acyltransferase